MQDRFAARETGRDYLNRRAAITARPATSTEARSAAVTRRKAALALFALSVGGFGIGLTEFLIAVLLAEVAGELGVPV